MTNVKKAAFCFTLSLILFAALAVTLASCFSPWTGEEELTDAAGADSSGTGSVTITIGGGTSGSSSVSYIAAGNPAAGNTAAQSRAVWTDDDKLPWDGTVRLNDLRHDISLAGGPGRAAPQTRIISPGGGIARFSELTEGSWEITVKAYLPGTGGAADELKAVGRKGIEIEAGQSKTERVEMAAPETSNVTVTFNVNGGSGTAPESQTVAPDTEITLPDGTGLSMANHTFGGWWVNSDGTGAFYTTVYDVTSSITLYARWTANITEIRLTPNAANVAPGGTQDFTAALYDADGRPVDAATAAGVTLTWTVESAPGVPAATITPTPAGASLTIPAAATDGAAYNVKASIAGVVESAPATVTVTAASNIASILVTAPYETVARGETLDFIATIRLNNGTYQSDANTYINWTVASEVSDTTINQDGLLSVAAGETATTLTVTATAKADSTKIGTKTVNVTGGAPGGGGTLPAYPPNGGLYKLINAGTEWWRVPSIGTTLTDAIDYLKTGSGDYVLVVGQTMAAEYPKVLSNPNSTLIITADSVGDKMIRLSGNVAARGSLFTVQNGAKLTLDTGITLSGLAKADPPVNNDSALVTVNGAGSKLIMKTGSTIKDNSTPGGLGGGVYVAIGSFEMQGGTISGNTGISGGVYINGGSFTMSGDNTIISDNTSVNGGGVYVTGGGSFTMSGGSVITENKTTAGSGGGVYFTGAGIFEMQGGTISDNTATSSGGGVFVSGGSFTMSSGTISGNSITGRSNGAGVCVSGSASFEMSGTSKIEGNRTPNGNGGGVWFGSTGNFTMSGNSKITGANIALNGAGVYLRDGTFEMQNGIISGNTATNNGGGVCVFSREAGQLFTKPGPGQITGNFAALNRGAAVYVESSPAYYREPPAGVGVTIHSISGQGLSLNG